MLEIYKSIEKKIANDKVTHDIVRIKKIEDDCWINLHAPTEEEIEELVNTIGVPSEFLRYPLDDEERPRVDVDEETGDMLIIVDIPYVYSDDEPSLYWTVPLGIIIMKRHIITVSLRDVPMLDAFFSNQVKDIQVNYRNRFAIQLLLSVAKDYLRLLRFMDKSIEGSERKLAKSTTNKELYRLLELSKSLVYFSTSLRSNEGVLERLMRGNALRQYAEDEELLDDAIIEFKQAKEMAEIYTSVVNALMDAYAAIINNNLNEIMKIMAAATIALSVPTIISSFFGQNCPMPWDAEFASKPIPFIILVLAGAASVVCAISVLRKHRML
ncbi:MAG: magnesium transporter CorA family protein [Clostridiales bacterium]|nr:magnesium transporter CorA family protein [Clostridiales bacterium]